jgi:tetratricopeptide (TPR) repeat protein
MRKFNFKLILCLVLGSVLLGGGGWGLHRLQVRRISQGWLQQAERAEKDGQLGQAVRYLERYLELVPGDIETRARMGRLLVHTTGIADRARANALFVLEQVLIRAPERHDSRRLAVRVALDVQRVERALEHVQYLQKSFPDDGEVENLFGQVREAQGKYAEAAAWYRKAVQHAPHQIDSYVRLATVLRRRLDPEKPGEYAKEADEVMRQLVTRNDQAVRAHLASWYYLKEWTDLKDDETRKQAGQHVRRALGLTPTDAEVLLAAAELAQLGDQIDQARNYLQTGLQHYPQEVRFYRALAALELQAGHRPAALSCLQQGIQVLPGPRQYELLWTLTNLLMDSGEMAEAEKTLDRMRKISAPPAALDYLQARLLMQRGQCPPAAKLLEQARSRLDETAELHNQIDYLLGQCYGQLDEPGRQLDALGRLVKRNPTAAARQELAAAQRAQGNLDGAIEQYQFLVRQPNVPPAAWVEMARLRLLRNLQREQRDWKEVEEALSRAEKVQPQSVEIPLLRAEALANQNQRERAVEVLQQARKLNPQEVRLWTALANLEEQRGASETAAVLLDEAKSQVGDVVELRLAHARRWAAHRNTGYREAMEQLEVGLEKFSPAEQARLLRGLAEIQYHIGNVKEATGLWNRLARLPGQENDPRLQMLLFELALQADDEKAMQNILVELQRIEEGQGALWRFCEAARLIWRARQGDTRGLDQARAHLEFVASARPGWSPVLVAKADLEDIRGNLEQAVANYKRAIDLGEHDPRVVRQLVQLLYKRQRYDEADQQIRKLQQQSPITADLQRLAVDVSLRRQDPIRAVKLARQAVPADSKDYHDYLWLGQVLAASGQQEKEAEDNLRHAVALADQVPETWVALVQYLASGGRQQDAETAIQQARTKLTDVQAPLALGLCYEAIGRRDQAREQYQAALAKQPDDVAVLRSVASFYLRAGPTHAAEPLLRTIIARKIKVSESDVSWGRRSLALVLSTTGTYRQFPEVLALVGLRIDRAGKIIEENGQGTESSVEDRSTRARVLASQDCGPLRARAVALLEGLNVRQVLAPDDRLFLAQLYETNRNWPKAREELRNLAAAYAKNPRYLVSYIRSLLRQKEVEEALNSIARLEQLESLYRVGQGGFGSLELRAQALEARGQGDKAIDLLKAQMEKNISPDRLLILVGYLARQKRIAEALDFCERAWPVGSPEAVGAASVAVLRSAQPTDDQVTRVERWLLEAKEKNSKAASLLLQLGDLYDLRGRYDEAAKLYRQVLEQEPDNLVALNNLAWLLAHRSGSGGEALVLINRALDAHGPKPALLDTRAMVYLALGQSDRAIADLQEATSDTPSASRYFHLARAHQLANNRKAALEALGKAKSSGLELHLLHPVERVAYRKMLDELEQR